jgi:hypothetical protein
LRFVQTILDADIPRIALENPVGCISTRIRKYDQKIQPWQFGHDASKGTCLWLKRLPLLHRNHAVVPPKGWKQVSFAADCVDEEGQLTMDWDDPDSEPGEFCSICGLPYSDGCECPGPTHDEVTAYKTIDGVLFGTFENPPRKPVWANQTPSGQNKLGPSADRWAERSKTYAGIAEAMAAQWGNLPNDKAQFREERA